MSPREGGQRATEEAAVTDAPDAVEATRRQARELAQTPIDWEHPERTLDRMTQIGFDGSGGTQCGAAAVNAGTILRGPEATGYARDQLLRRARTFESDDNPEVKRRTAQERETLEGLPQDPQTWTLGDAHRLQQATNQIGRAQQLQDGRLHPDGQPTTMDMRSMRDLT